MILKNWSIIHDAYDAPELGGRLHGRVYGHPNFEDGTHVRTSRIDFMVNKDDCIEATTQSGSIYKFFKEDVSAECEKEYPNYYERLRKVTEEEMLSD